MTFPLDPNAPGGPRRTEFVALSVATVGGRAEPEPVVLAVVGGEPVAAPGLRAGDARVAEPARAGAGG